MGLSDFFGFSGAATTSNELPIIFNFEINLEFFMRSDITALFKKIFTDCIDRIYGIKEKDEAALWDNCLANESTNGLLSLLCEAIYGKQDLFLVYKLDVLRKADQEETAQIKLDYEARGTSKIGVYVSFKNYSIVDLLKIYSGMEYCVLASLNKSMNLSKAIQIKVADMRKSISEYDKDLAVNQARSIALGLSEGKDIIIDAGDEIVTSKPDMEATDKAIKFINQKKAFILGLPEAYITGEQTGGIGATGEADAKAVERALRNYYVSILRPVLNALFNSKTSFKSQDFRQVASGLEALKTFELISDELLTLENKKIIIDKLFNIEAK